MIIKNINLISIALEVAEETINNIDEPFISNDNKQYKICNSIGIFSRRVTRRSTLDLMYSATDKLINNNHINIHEIDCLVCVTQTPNQLIPGNSFLLCERFGLSKNIFTMDINAGCSGFTHGLITIAKFMESSPMRYGVLVLGDTLSKLIHEKDTSSKYLFGDACTACLFENRSSENELHALWRTLPELYDKISIPGNLIDKIIDTKESNASDFYLKMEGLDVFSFSISEVPALVHQVLNYANITIEDIDYFVFHQANKMIVDYICNKIGISLDKRILQLDGLGNTSSASIPAAICLHAKNGQLSSLSGMFCLTGFGVGLSLSCVVLKVNDLHIL